MKTLISGAALAVALSFTCPALAQDAMSHDHHEMPDRADMPVDPAPDDAPPVAVPGSGTALAPGNAGGMGGFHWMSGDWMLMAHGALWGVYSDQGGPRGASKAFTASMAMLEASGPVGDGGVRVQLRTMLSLDPVNGQRGYPLLFATGETAHGEPLVDRQHPHDFVMELAGRIEADLGGGATAFVYGGPVGEPALGPSAFMHRASARFNPEAPISHHWFDSTHITFGVVTAGVRFRAIQIEASAFRGREPDENRWDIETPRLDSWSMRATLTPSPAWTAQLSYGRLEAPEATHPGEDEGRLTASLSHVAGPLAAEIGYSRKRRLPGPTLEAWYGEADYALSDRHHLFGRAELVETDELFDHDSPLHDVPVRVGKLTAGYAYRLPLGDGASFALGVAGSVYRVPALIRPSYGRSPESLLLFAKLSLGD